jgi:hypothetical protein
MKPDAEPPLVMYGRPPLGKGILLFWRAGRERSCIRPLCAVRRPLALRGFADRVPIIAARW